MSPTFSSLKFRNYRLWFAGALVANVGTWMQRVAQDWLVFTELTDESGVAVGITTALQFAPVLLLSPYAGLLADRIDRRKLLIATQVGQGVLAAGLGVLVLSGHAQLWHVYLFALALGCVTAIDGPVRQTFVAELVPAHKLSNAVGLNSASFNAARLIGPGVAGLLIAAIGTGWVFLINAVTFVATIFSLTRMRTSELSPMPTHAARQGAAARGHRLRARTQRHPRDHGRGRRGLHVRPELPADQRADGAQRVRQGRGRVRHPRLGAGHRLPDRRPARRPRERPRVRLVIGAAFGFGIAIGVMALMPTYLSFAIACIPVGLRVADADDRRELDHPDDAPTPPYAGG